MNTEHYKTASERTDEAERALTPAFKTLDKMSKLETEMLCPDIGTFASQMELERDHYKAHADKLAEALSHLLARPEDASEYQKAEATLAAYEESK